MAAEIRVPKRLFAEAASRGIDLGDLVTTMLAKELGKGLEWLASARAEMAEDLISHTGEGAAEACEKMLRAAAECIKALSEKLGTRQAQEAFGRGYWSTALVEEAAAYTSIVLNENRILSTWTQLNRVCKEMGAPEAKKHIEIAKLLTQWLAKYTKSLVNK